MDPIAYTNNSHLDHINFDDPPRKKKKGLSLQAQNSSTSLLKSESNQLSSSTFKAIDISNDVKNTVKGIRAENKTLRTKKISEKKLSYIITAATLSIVAGLILSAAGVIALATGAGLPIGLGLIAVGAGLFAAGCGTLKFFSKEINTLDKIEKNNKKIDSLKYLKKGVLAHNEERFKDFLKDLKNNLSINLNIPDFFVKYPQTLDLYKLFVLKEEESEIRRYDNYYRRTYPATTDYSLSMIRFINTLIEEALAKDLGKDDLKSLYDTRKSVVKDLPIIHESMSIDTIEKIILIRKRV